MERYDLIVIGGGPAGYAAAGQAAKGGLSVALFERRSLGGVCLNEGCIPTKSLLYAAKMLDNAAHGAAFGLMIGPAALDHKAVVSRKDKVVKTLVSGVGAKMKSHGVDVFPASAAIQGKTAGGFAVEAGGQAFTASKLLIATGSAPVIPPIPGVREGLDSGFVVTSREILDMQEVPERLLIVGGGVIGLEMAGYFSAAGSKVLVVEMLDKIAGPFDPEISTILQKNLEKRGVEFRLGAKVSAVGPDGVRIEPAGGGPGTAAPAPNGGSKPAGAPAPNGGSKPAGIPAGATAPAGDPAGSFAADNVLLSIGRKPATEGIGLENIGLAAEGGAIATDRMMRTSVPGVYAAGDVNGKSMLAHTAYREAETAVNNMLGRKGYMRYSAIPSVIYTQPEAAGAGETEASAAENGFAAKCIKLSMRYAGRYVAENDGGDGICKLIIDTKSRRVLGAHMIGSYASEIISSAVFMIESGWPLETLKEIVFPHPTVGEILREALFEME
ncbi:MAG: NAD(P)/FAD-dependent oxidoreductase [Clostridiales Family XIII bacterium]|jgi:dihydrolipoamide dehydrogenase|nr:NAD(P)/FAD-dependent oxidoreductase [Clostridiales Family XIII bacterium]